MYSFTESIIFAMHIPIPKYFIGFETKGMNLMNAVIEIHTNMLGIHNICVWKEEIKCV